MAKSVLDALYHTTRWRFARAAHLAKHPLCQRCESLWRVRAASLVDHNPPCGDSVSAFWDPKRYRSLCAKCRAAVRSEQKRGFSNAVGLDGRATDPRHPANAESAPFKQWPVDAQTCPLTEVQERARQLPQHLMAMLARQRARAKPK
jgi:5-methylcytosine-specific restriction protein A